ncbi:MAG TPA: TetR/AcrR family transcriptional regulator, partial [Lunatimonas sp.]|nr:TetR/AcrR family transcriptional regulator [Lunatimonas sp.]
MTENIENQIDYREAIVNGYVEHILEHGRQPASIFKFAKSLNMKEEEFYNYFTSFEAIKSAVWEMIFDKTVAELEGQEVY